MDCTCRGCFRDVGDEDATAAISLRPDNTNPAPGLHVQVRPDKSSLLTKTKSGIHVKPHGQAIAPLGVANNRREIQRDRYYLCNIFSRYFLKSTGFFFRSCCALILDGLDANLTRRVNQRPLFLNGNIKYTKNFRSKF